ncbi:MAG: iron ABC transporter permease [Bacteroidales bacterium]|nr:iron ABC transporter permease [Bacteroidales bacterium]
MISNSVKFIILFVILFIFGFLSLKLGSVDISLTQVFSAFFSDFYDKSVAIILFEIRLPRLISALFAGAAISISGLLMQTTFQNPLAGPYVLGISSGAGLGVAFVMLGAEFFGLGIMSLNSAMLPIIIGALIGSAFVLSIVLMVAKKVKSLTTLLILGILFSGAASSIVNILQYFAEASNVKTYAIWSMGNLGGISLNQSFMFAILITFALIFVFAGLRNFDAFMLGEIQAQSLGIHVVRTRLFILVLAGFLAAIVTAFIGPIAFIGIAVPHIARTFFSSFSHRIIVPATILIGANIMIISDIISRIPGSIYIIPINSITSLIGIPIVVWLLISKKQINF